MDPWSLRQGGSSGRGPSFPSIFLASLFIGSEKYYAWKKKPLPKEKEPLDHEGTKEPLTTSHFPQPFILSFQHFLFSPKTLSG